MVFCIHEYPYTPPGDRETRGILWSQEKIARASFSKKEFLPYLYGSSSSFNCFFTYHKQARCARKQRLNLCSSISDLIKLRRITDITHANTDLSGSSPSKDLCSREIYCILTSIIVIVHTAIMSKLIWQKSRFCYLSRQIRRLGERSKTPLVS